MHGEVTAISDLREQAFTNSVLPTVQIHKAWVKEAPWQTIAGFSGAPLVVDDCVVGIVRSSWNADDGHAIGGTIDITPIEAVLIEMGLPATERPSRSEPAAQFEGPGRVEVKQVPYFTGRVRALDELRLLLRNENSTTVCVVAAGSGGIGKTMLAQQFVATRARELFPDGVAWLGGRSLAAEIWRLCVRFGLTADRQLTPEQAFPLLYPKLRGRRMLLVVDNFFDGKARDIPRPGGSCRTLVSSRSTSIHDLLDARRLLGRLPLGVRLVAALLCRRERLTPSEALTTLQNQQLRALEKYASDDLRGVAATFAESYETLIPDARRVLQALAVCARGTRAEVVAPVAGVDDVEARLDELCDQSLAEYSSKAEAPWGLHDVLRMFVLEQPGREEFEAWHEEWVRGHIAAYSDEKAYSELGTGVDETWAAFERLVAQDPVQSELLYRGLFGYLRRVGRYADAITLSESMLAAARPDSALAWNTMNNLTGCYGALGDIPKAIEWLLTIDANPISPVGRAFVLGNLGACYLRLGKFETAIRYSAAALGIEEFNTHENRGWVLGNLGVCYQQLERFADAIQWFTNALSVGPRGTAEEALHLGNLGLCYRNSNIQKAIDFHQRSLAIARGVGYREGQALQLCNLGAIAARLGDRTQARDYLTRGIDLFESMGFPVEHPDRQMAAMELASLEQ